MNLELIHFIQQIEHKQEIFHKIPNSLLLRHIILKPKNTSVLNGNKMKKLGMTAGQQINK